MKRIAVLFLVLLFIPVSLGAAAEAADTAGIKQAVESFLSAEMQRQAGIASTEWERYIYAQGLAELDMDLAKFDITKEKPLAVSFMVASGQPDVKNQPPYQGDPEPFLRGIIQAMGTMSVKVKLSLLITEQNGYLVTYAKGGEASLQKTVKGQATKAQKAMADKTVLAALVDYLMPTPIIMPKKAPANPALEVKNLAYESYVQRNNINPIIEPFTGAMLYGIKGQKLDASYGPEKIVLKYTVPFFSTMLQKAAENLCEELAFDRKAKDYTNAELNAQFLKQVEKDLIAYRYGKKSDVEEMYQINLLDLSVTVKPADLYQHESDNPTMTGIFLQAAIAGAVAELPDYPAIRDPKTGVVSGSNNGTKVVFQFNKFYKDEYNRSVSVYDMADRRISVTYIAAGKQASIRIPQGLCYFKIGVGRAWYGPENLFGPAGYYYQAGSREEPLDIPSSRYYLQYPVETGGRRTQSVSNTELEFEGW